MVQLGVSKVPKAHILKRWTRKARDLLPGELRCYQQDTLCMESMTYRHTYLYVNAIEVVQDGNKDLGAFDIATQYIKKAQKKLREYYKAKENDKCTPATNRVVMQSNYYTTDSDTGVDSGSEKEAGLGNSYGAAGSSAMMSDSELLKLWAPAFKRPAGRPIQIHKKGFLETYGKKRKRKSNNDFGIGTGAPIINNEEPNQKKKIRCSECQILGHNATNCRKKHVDLNTEIPKF